MTTSDNAGEMSRARHVPVAVWINAVSVTPPAGVNLGKIGDAE
jgi:hypothetical protein